MEISVFKSKYEALLKTAKELKENGTNVSMFIFTKGGLQRKFTQENGEFYKFEIDDTAGTLRIGNKATNDTDGLIFKTFALIDINSIEAFEIEIQAKSTTT